jgi:DNA (cytosine-5)-methyltransferase 1
VIAQPLLGHDGHRNNADENFVAQPLLAHGQRGDYESETFVADTRPLTLAIRGRDGESTLEWSDDGVANAILTPNGGRGGIGVGAVAYGLRSDASREGVAKTPSPDAAGRVRLRDPGFNVYEELAPTIDAGQAHTVAFNARQDPDAWVERTGPLDVLPTQAVALHENQRGEISTNVTAGALKTSGGKPGQGYPAVQSGMAVRRLTPRECERLQGFPDDYTAITYRGKPASDGPRYKALGNSMAVPVMAWIGKRIAMVAEIQK